MAAPHTSIPGHPRWQLAPREMAWEGKTLGEICEQLKDPERNRHRTPNAARRTSHQRDAPFQMKPIKNHENASPPAAIL